MKNCLDIFDSLPGSYVILSAETPDFVILGANAAYLAVTQTTRDIIGKSLFEIFPDNPHDPEAAGVKNLTAALHEVIRSREKQEMDILRYDTPLPGGEGFARRYWKLKNTPVPDEGEEVKYIIISVEDVTNLVLLEKDLQTQDHRNQQQIREAVLTTQEMERMEISQELHDNVNQILNTARLYLEKAMDPCGSRQDFLHLGHSLVGKAIEEVKNLSYALLRYSKEEMQLTEALEELLSQVVEVNPINIVKSIELPDEALIESKVKTTIIRILQEQLTNVVKHADAKNLYITVGFQNNHLELTIKDDGKGFDMLNVRQGLGFQNIKSRAAIMDGRVQITSYPGDGCQIQVFLPVH